MTEDKNTTKQKDQSVEEKPIDKQQTEIAAVVNAPISDPLVDVGLEVKAGDKKTNKRRSVKGKPARQVSLGRAYIKSSYNNTIVTLTDQNGNVLAWSSAGQCGFKGPKKATPYAASMIVKDAFEKSRKHGLKEVAVFVNGIGGGRDAAIRALNANGLAIGGIKDITPIPHNGCRAKKPRRV